MNNMQSEMEQLLKDISILDFTLVDFSEYLDLCKKQISR